MKPMPHLLAPGREPRHPRRRWRNPRNRVSLSFQAKPRRRQRRPPQIKNQLIALLLENQQPNLLGRVMASLVPVQRIYSTMVPGYFIIIWYYTSWFQFHLTSVLFRGILWSRLHFCRSGDPGQYIIIDRDRLQLHTGELDCQFDGSLHLLARAKGNEDQSSQPWMHWKKMICSQIVPTQ